jgi:hypothetical protein
VMSGDIALIAAEISSGGFDRCMEWGETGVSS